MSIGNSSQRSHDRSSQGVCLAKHFKEWGPWENEDTKGTKYDEKLCAVNEIGRGGFGTVYKGHKCIFNPKVGQWICIAKDQLAIKVVDPDHGGKGSTYKHSYAARIAQLELEVHKKLTNHEFLVTSKMLPKRIPEDSPTVLALEYCAHGDLEKYMRKRNLTHLRSDNEKLAKTLVGSVVKGLKALRGIGFFHRDIKASNIFVTGSQIEDPIFKLGDFGLVARIKDQNRGICGTPTTMAPEMNGRYYYDEKIDIWSLGILLYAKLLNEKPFAFDAKDTNARIRAQQEPLVLEHKDISAEAKSLLQCMLQSDPIRRIDLNGVERHEFLHQNQLELNMKSDLGYRTMAADSGFITSSTLLSGHTNVYQPTRTAKYTTPTPMMPLPGLRESSQSGLVFEDVRVPRPNSRMSQFDHPSLSGIQPRGSVVPSTCLSRNAGIIKPDRLNTKRVKCRNSIKTSKTSRGKILENGEVEMEITRLKKLYQNGLPTSIEEIETFSVSHDGTTISVKRSQKPEERYKYADLPNKYWKQYSHASNFVNYLREKTKRITNYFGGGFWVLYDGPRPNFEMFFYKSNIQISYVCKEDVIQILKEKKVLEKYASHTKSLDQSHPYHKEWLRFCEQKEKAERMSKFHEENDNGGEMDAFPIVIGNRNVSSSR